MLQLVGLAINLPGQEVVWVRRLDFGGQEYGRGVAVDSRGNIILSGQIERRGRFCDILVVKCNADGETLWTYTYGDSGTVEQSWRNTTDGNDNIYIAGNYIIGDTAIEEAGGLLLKLSPQGEMIWERRLVLSGVGVVFLAPLADACGNIYVVGVVDSILPYPSQYGILCKYDSTGHLIWEREYRWTNLLIGITGRSDSLYLTGEDATTQLTVLCIDTLGDTIWSRVVSWGEFYSRGNGITVDSAGDVIATGYTIDTLGYFDLVMVKLNRSGNPVWLWRCNYLPEFYDWGFDVVTDRFNNIYVAGNRGAFFTIGNYYTIKLTPAGDTVWTASYGRANTDDFAYSIARDMLDNPVVIGQSEAEIGNYDFLAIKYAGTGGIEEREPNVQKYSLFTSNVISASERLLQIFIAAAGNYRLTVADIAGQKRAVVYAGYLDAGKHRLRLPALSAGVYFLTTEAEGIKARHRLVVVR
jgi:hypothetical protein